MHSLIYEHLIRSAFDVDRGGQGGAADASLYRDWEVSIRSYELQKEAIEKKQMPHDVRSLEDLEYEMKVSASQIRDNVKFAITNVLRTPRPKEIEVKLKVFQEELDWDLYDKKKIDLVIVGVWDLFRKIKLPQT